MKEQEKIKKGDKVKCLFGNSGHKFWPQLKGELEVEYITDLYKGVPRLLYFKGIDGTGFHENDFAIITPPQPATVEEAQRLNQWQLSELKAYLHRRARDFGGIDYVNIDKFLDEYNADLPNYAQQPDPNPEAETILKSTHAKYPGQYGSLVIQDWQIEAMQTYARLQIEQDRERVKASISEVDTNLLKSKGYQLMRAIDETPIIPT